MSKKKRKLLTALVFSFLLIFLPSLAVEAAEINVSTYKGDLRLAVERANAGDTIVLDQTGEVNDTGSDSAPWLIDKNITIQGGNVDMRAGGIILGADVAFSDVTLGFTNYTRNVIAANGHTLTLHNTTYDTGSNQVHLFCGTMVSFSGSVASTQIPSPGAEGKIVITSDKAISLGNIYAGNIYTDGNIVASSIPATIEVNVAKNSTIGMANTDTYWNRYGTVEAGIYATGALQTQAPDINLDPASYTQHPPVPDTSYAVNGAVTIKLNGGVVRKVDGATGGSGNTAVIFNGDANLVNGVTLTNLSSLTVETGKFSPAASSDLTNTNVSVKGTARLGFDNITNPVIKDFTGEGSGTIVLGSSQKLTITGQVSGQAKVSIDEYNLDQSADLVEDQVYIEATNSSENSFEIWPCKGNPDMLLVYDQGAWKGKMGESSVVIRGLTINNNNNVTADDTNEGVMIPVTVDYVTDPFVADMSLVPVTIKLNSENLKRTRPLGYNYQNSDETVDVFFGFTDDEYLFVYGPGENDQLPVGIYNITIEIPSGNMEDKTSKTISFTLTVESSDASTPTPSPLSFVDSEDYDLPETVVGTAITNINVSAGVKGGITPYTYEAEGLPEGITIDKDTGVISGTPSEAQDATTATITVKDSTAVPASAYITITVGAVSSDSQTPPSTDPEELTFTDSTAYDIPAATVGTAITRIDVSKGVSGGTEPYTYKAEGLPEGITINETTGIISGTPTKAQEAATATITVTDSASVAASASITIQVGKISEATEEPEPDPSEPESPLTFTDNTAYDIPATTVGTAITRIDVSKGVSGGTEPYTYTAKGLPEGITIDKDTGIISGTPTKAQDATTATITVTDSASEAASASITIQVGKISEATEEPEPDPSEPESPLTFTDSTAYDIPAATVGTAITRIDVSKGVSGGTEPYTYKAEGLPEGITINETTGIISGTPTKAQEATTATITVTDSASEAVSASITIQVGKISEATEEPEPDTPSEQEKLAFTDSDSFDLPASVVGKVISDIDVSVGVKGGTAPYTYKAEGLPEGITINETTGIISGTPTTAQDATTATITVTDSASEAASASITIQVGKISEAAEEPPKAQTYKVIAISSPTEGGTITGKLEALEEGANVTLTAEANFGWSFTGWKSEDIEISDASSLELKFSMPAKNITITAIFEQKSIENVPDGLWMEEIPEQNYNGKPIKPEVRVYYKDRLLTNKDYTVSYKNNTQVAAFDAVNAKGKSIAPTIVIKGKGNYKGTVTRTFTINPIDLSTYQSDASLQEILKISPVYVKKTGREIKGVPAFKLNGKSISAKAKQYTLAYNDSTEGAYVEPGTYTITIQGAGKNFVGSTTVLQTISDKLISRASITLDQTSYPYNKVTGETYPGKVTVKEGGATLEENVHYTVSYLNYDRIGTATVVVTGKGDYSGVKTKTYKITGSQLSASMVEQLAGFTYEEKEHSVVEGKNFRILDNGTPLEAGKDYRISYSGDRVNAGSFKVTFTGINQYSGSVIKTYKIEKVPVSSLSVTLANADQIAFAKNGATPKPEVRFGNTLLTEGKDYSISYMNNKKTALKTDSAAPGLYLTGKGNFTGNTKETPVQFSIVASSLAEQTTLTVEDVLYKNKKNNYVPKVTLTDKNSGKKLARKTDYSTDFTYELWDEATGRYEPFTGERVEEPAVRTRMRITVSGAGSYSGTIQAEYELYRKSITSVKVSRILPQEYTGEEITPIPEVTIRVKEGNTYKNVPLEKENYEISYANNVNKGTATLFIHGKGEYGGMKKVSFKIISWKMSWWESLLEGMK